MDIGEYGENVAAITATMHEDKEGYQKMYDNLSSNIGGFVGIWAICAEAGKAFTEEAAQYMEGDCSWWIEAIEDFTQKMMGAISTGTAPSSAELHLWAAGSIEKNR